MKQPASNRWIPGLVAVTGLALAWSALSLPGRPYAGILLRGAEVIAVDPGGPGDRAGIRPGDRLIRQGPATLATALAGPLAAAAPGRPLVLGRDGPGPVRLVPGPLPAAEWRFGVALFTVAAGFLMLAGLVWNERRDRLTAAFARLALAFAWLLAPFPRLDPPALALPWTLAYAAATLAVPALAIQFFALFPEPPARGRRTGILIRGAWTTSALLLGAALVALLPAARAARPVVEALAALWFAAGLGAALALFARSTLRAGTADARRRLRVALLGLVFGVVPLAVAMLARSLSPAGLPFDRWLVPLTLLVPATFAWAIAVHRVFDIGVALRVGAMAAALAAGSGLAAIAPDALAPRDPEPGRQAAGGLLLAIVGAALAAGPLSQRLARGAFPGLPDAPAAGRAASAEAVLGAACDTLLETLRLDRCAALAVARGEGGRVVARAGTRFTAPPPGPAALAALGELREAVAVEDLPGDPAWARALEQAGVRWVLPAGGDQLRAVLLLGRRLAGAWLGRHEARDLARFAERLGLALDNAALRDQARRRDALTRELEIARDVQIHRLPRRVPAYPTLDCAAAALSSRPVGGDYYDFVAISPRAFALAAGDAAGQGVPAALVLAGIQTRFRTEAARGIGPGRILDTLNRELIAYDQPDRFMALLCAQVDVRRARVVLANAGLPPPLIRRRDGRVESITPGGVLLGVSPAATYPDVAVTLDAGDLLVLHTDGLTEARRGDELLGGERVAAVLERAAHRRAGDVLDALLHEVRDFAGGPLDDLTVVVLRQLAGPAAPAPAVQFPLKSAPQPAESTG